MYVCNLSKVNMGARTPLLESETYASVTGTVISAVKEGGKDGSLTDTKRGGIESTATNLSADNAP